MPEPPSALNESENSSLDEPVKTWKMFWLVPVVCSLFLLLSAYSLLSALPVASYVFAAVGTIVLLSTPILTKLCRIEMTKNRIVVYDLLGKVAKDLPKEDIESIEILRGEDPCTWVHTKNGKYMIPGVYYGVDEILEVLSSWAKENSNIKV